MYDTITLKEFSRNRKGEVWIGLIWLRKEKIEGLL